MRIREDACRTLSGVDELLKRANINDTQSIRHGRDHLTALQLLKGARQPIEAHLHALSDDA